MSDASMTDVVERLLRATRSAQLSWVNGNSEPYVAMFADPSELSIYGPFGGPLVEGGNSETRSAAAARVASMFESGEAEVELLRTIVSDQLICLVLLERCRVKFSDHSDPRAWTLRTTQIYRRGSEGWRIVHRHAEPLIAQRSLEETLDLLDD